MAGQQIDRDKLRTAHRKLRPEDLFHMLEEAITLLPQEQLLGLAKPHLNVSTLVDLIDEGSDEVLFFADDGGSWEFGEDWHEVLPPWFRVLAATSAPEEFAERVLAILKARCAFGSDKMLAAAHKTATPEQAKALVAREKAQPEISNR